MVESAMENIQVMERLDFHNFKISAKASSVPDTICVYRSISERCDYPLHLGVTEAGPLLRGTVKSSVGLGVLLAEGIGDTLRVSLTGRSLDEVRAGYLILGSLGLRTRGVDIISCPTCGRTMVDLPGIVDEVEKMTSGIRSGLKLAVMGCIVNGPGEAAHADLGLAYTRHGAALFENGSIVTRGEREAMEQTLVTALERRVEALTTKKVMRSGTF